MRELAGDGAVRSDDTAFSCGKRMKRRRAVEALMIETFGGESVCLTVELGVRGELFM